jgi:ribosome maturation factor RimP
VEDYSLEVSSPDLTKPLKVFRQYLKNIGRDLSVKKADKSKTEGELIAATEHDLTLLTSQKEEVPGKKGKKLVEREITIPFSEITEAKVMIRFK